MKKKNLAHKDEDEMEYNGAYHDHNRSENDYSTVKEPAYHYVKY